MLQFSHNIPDLLKHLTNLKQNWNEKIQKDEWDLLITISEINFPKLRYVQPQKQTFTINFRSLKTLLIQIFNLLKEIRFNNTNSVSQEEQRSQQVGRIFGHVEKKSAPRKFRKENFEKMLNSNKLSQTQIELINKSYKITDSDVLLQSDEKNQELISAIELTGVEVWDLGEIRFEIT